MEQRPYLLHGGTGCECADLTPHPSLPHHHPSLLTLHHTLNYMYPTLTLLPQRVEEQEKEEEAAGARITVKRKRGKGKTTGRQTKLTGDSGSSNSLKETRPSPFAEVVDPVIPGFCAKKKAVGKCCGSVKAKPKLHVEKKKKGSEEGHQPLLR